MSASVVRHIRDRSGEVTAVRGWPRCTTVIEEIARLDEWYASLSRSAVLRASIGLLLEKDQALGSPAALDGGFGPSQVAQSLDRQYGTGGPPEDVGGERRRPYHEFSRHAGGVVELEPGYKPHPVPPMAPTAQEAQVMAMEERRVCGALRVTPATLLGDYKSVSYSGGQLGHMQERQGIEDYQSMLIDQFYAARLPRVPHGPLDAPDGGVPGAQGRRPAKRSSGRRSCCGATRCSKRGSSSSRCSTRGSVA